ncbi:hypothetical protein C0993_003437, partial [Termitomyces sp. T159_Od127]
GKSSAADTLLQMPVAPPTTCLAACAYAYTHSLPKPCIVAGGLLKIETDKGLLEEIVAGYKNDVFAQQVCNGIEKSSIVGA